MSVEGMGYPSAAHGRQALTPSTVTSTTGSTGAIASTDPNAIGGPTHGHQVRYLGDSADGSGLQSDTPGIGGTGLTGEAKKIYRDQQEKRGIGKNDVLGEVSVAFSLAHINARNVHKEAKEYLATIQYVIGDPPNQTVITEVILTGVSSNVPWDQAEAQIIRNAKIYATAQATFAKKLFRGDIGDIKKHLAIWRVEIPDSSSLEGAGVAGVTAHTVGEKRGKLARVLSLGRLKEMKHDPDILMSLSIMQRAALATDTAAKKVLFAHSVQFNAATGQDPMSQGEEIDEGTGSSDVTTTSPRTVSAGAGKPELTADDLALIQENERRLPSEEALNSLRSILNSSADDRSQGVENWFREHNVPTQLNWGDVPDHVSQRQDVDRRHQNLLALREAAADNRFVGSFESPDQLTQLEGEAQIYHDQQSGEVRVRALSSDDQQEFSATLKRTPQGFAVQDTNSGAELATMGSLTNLQASLAQAQDTQNALAQITAAEADLKKIHEAIEADDGVVALPANLSRRLAGLQKSIKGIPQGQNYDTSRKKLQDQLDQLRSLQQLLTQNPSALDLTIEDLQKDGEGGYHLVYWDTDSKQLKVHYGSQENRGRPFDTVESPIVWDADNSKWKVLSEHNDLSPLENADCSKLETTYAQAAAGVVNGLQTWDTQLPANDLPRLSDPENTANTAQDTIANALKALQTQEDNLNELQTDDTRAACRPRFELCAAQRRFIMGAEGAKNAGADRGLRFLSPEQARGEGSSPIKAGETAVYWDEMQDRIAVISAGPNNNITGWLQPKTENDGSITLTLYTNNTPKGAAISFGHNETYASVLANFETMALQLNPTSSATAEPLTGLTQRVAEAINPNNLTSGESLQKLHTEILRIRNTPNQSQQVKEGCDRLLHQITPRLPPDDSNTEDDE